MDLFLFFLILFVALAGGGWLIGKAFGNFLFPAEKKDNITFINNITHTHHHEHKHISIIDDETKKRIFELKESNNKKATR